MLLTLSLELETDVIGQLMTEADMSGQSLDNYVAARIADMLRPIGDGEPEAEPPWGTADYILLEAVRLIKENQIHNRELAVEVITQQNNLQAEVAKQERIVAEMQRKADLATKDENVTLAEQFLKERELHAKTLESIRASLGIATEMAEKVKTAIKAEEERIRVRTAEVLALKAMLKQARIGAKISTVLDGLYLGDSDTAQELNTEWKTAFNGWVDSLDDRVKEALQRKPEGRLRRKLIAWKQKRVRRGPG